MQAENKLKNADAKNNLFWQVQVFCVCISARCC